MEVLIRPTAADAVRLAARMIAETVRSKPACNLGLATGGTMEAVYADLVEMNRRGEVDFSQVTSFNLDEYVGLGPDHPNSYRHYMDFHLFDRVNIDKRRTHLPDGLAKDEAAETAAYEEAIRAAGGIDLQLLGIGCDGHIAFNEPGCSLAGRTHVQLLTPATYEQNSGYFNPPESMPMRAFTLGVGTIMEARRTVLLITGKRKAEIAVRAIEGPVTAMVTASALQFHPDAVAILDEEAAALLGQKEYYRGVFEKDPRWALYR